MFANMETIWKHISGRFTTRLPFGLESHSLPNMLFQILPKLTIDTEHRVNVRARSRSMASSEQRDTVDSLLESALEGEQNETRLVCRKKKCETYASTFFELLTDGALPEIQQFYRTALSFQRASESFPNAFKGSQSHSLQSHSLQRLRLKHRMNTRKRPSSRFGQKSVLQPSDRRRDQLQSSNKLTLFRPNVHSHN